MKAIQQSREADNLDQWKSARDSGAIKTASSGLKRDADSSRMGSAGLFAERADAKMPYIDRGYVQETTSDGIPIKKKQESAPAAPNPFAGFQNPRPRRRNRAPAPAPAPAPAAPSCRTLRRLLRQAQNSRTGAGARARGAEPFGHRHGKERRQAASSVAGVRVTVASMASARRPHAVAATLARRTWRTCKLGTYPRHAVAASERRD